MSPWWKKGIIETEIEVSEKEEPKVDKECEPDPEDLLCDIKSLTRKLVRENDTIGNEKREKYVRRFDALVDSLDDYNWKEVTLRANVDMGNFHYWDLKLCRKHHMPCLAVGSHLANTFTIFSCGSYINKTWTDLDPYDEELGTTEEGKFVIYQFLNNYEQILKNVKAHREMQIKRLKALGMK